MPISALCGFHETKPAERLLLISCPLSGNEGQDQNRLDQRLRLNSIDFRSRFLNTLKTRGALSGAQIAAVLGVTRQAAHRHLVREPRHRNHSVKNIKLIA